MTTPAAPASSPAQPPADISAKRLIALGVGARLLIDTCTQFFGAFLPYAAAGLGTNPVVMGRLVSLRSLVGLSAPLAAWLSERAGYRVVLRLALILAAVGTLIVGSSRSVAMAAVGMVVWGVGLAAFVPTLQAYLSARLPYATRSRGIGVVEYAWALSGILGLWLVGQIITLTSWRVPLWLLGGGLLIAALVYRTLPPTGRAREQTRAAAPRDSRHVVSRLRALWRSTQGYFALDLHARSAYSAILANAFQFFAAVQLVLAHGVWLEREYGLNAALLGTVAVVLGLTDLTASGGVSVFGDLLGKWRGVVLGGAVAVVGYLLLPSFNVGLVPAVAGLALARFGFEFGLVSNIVLLSEQVPSQRAKVLTLSASITLLGATAAGYTGPLLYERFGIGAVSAVSCASSAVGLALVLLFVRERG